jgi:hypothetical protein
MVTFLKLTTVDNEKILIQMEEVSCITPASFGCKVWEVGEGDSCWNVQEGLDTIEEMLKEKMKS